MTVRFRAARGGGLIVVVLLTLVTVVGFGAAAAQPAVGSPIGHVDDVQIQPTFLRVLGWAADPDNDPTFTAAVAVFVDGALVAYDDAASEDRPDVGGAYPYGSAHGFDLSFPWNAGQHEICTAAINASGTPGEDTMLGCTETTGTPFGNLESLTVSGLNGVATGWAIDPDTQAPTSIAVYVDAQLVGWVPMADLERADVGSAYFAYGPNHGFEIPFQIPTGAPHVVCVAAQNVAGTDGHDVILGCPAIDTTPHFAGSIDFVEQTDLGLRVGGWIADIDSPGAQVPVAVFIDGELVAYLAAAGGHREDVGAATPYGPDHGYDISFFTSPGVHELCLTSVSASSVEGVFACVDVNKLSLK